MNSYIETNSNIYIKDNSTNIISLNNNGKIKAETIELNTGTIEHNPINDTDIVNKKYISNNLVSKNDTNEQQINGPLNLQNQVKFTALLIPINTNN